MTVLVLLGALLLPTSPVWADDAPSISVLRLESELDDQARADEVTSVLLELLSETDGVEMVDRTDVTMGDLALLYGCEHENIECLGTIATDFATEQVLYGVVEPFGDDLTVKIYVYDSSEGVVRPVYSRRMAQPEVVDVLRADLGDLFFGRLWELPAYLTVQTPGADGAAVKVDGKSYGVTPLERARVVPGVRTVEVFAKGRPPWSKEVEFVSGEAAVLDVELPPAPEDDDDTAEDGSGVADSGGTDDGVDDGTVDGPPDALPEDGEEVYRAPAGGWVALGIGGASLIGAAITGGLTLSAESDYENELRERQSADLEKRVEDLALTTNILVGIGSAAVATSAVLFLTMGEWEVVSTESSSVRLDPSISPTDAGLRLHIEF